LFGVGADGGWATADLPMPVGNTTMVSVVLHADRPLVPFKAGLGNDTRELGFGLKKIGVR